MFIITKINVAELITEVCDVCQSFNESIEVLHNILGDTSDEDHKVMIEKKRVDVYKRNHGIIYNSKDLKFVYQIIEH